VPVRVQLPVAAGRGVSKAFFVDQKAAYAVEISLRREIEFQEVERIQQLGFDWSVSSNGKTVCTDRSGMVNGIGMDVFGLGEFVGVPGQRYVIQARVKKATSKLRGLDPHLVVGVSGRYMEGLSMTAALLQCLACFLALIAVPSLAVGAYRVLRERSRAQPQAAEPTLT
jgi:hypothetical protein